MKENSKLTKNSLHRWQQWHIQLFRIDLPTYFINRTETNETFEAECSAHNNEANNKRLHQHYTLTKEYNQQIDFNREFIMAWAESIIIYW